MGSRSNLRPQDKRKTCVVRLLLTAGKRERVFFAPLPEGSGEDLNSVLNGLLQELAGAVLPARRGFLSKTTM